ncbi:hypothetical protein AbraIFM66951_003458 [Aspergillus brasiliensis]|uniref:AT hook motif protein n=1 Tax=Aspergillus brasiliensis TaxID=319629 RepID=A0A9W6DKZ5_9EURO|nr:hypothetical protein AbraCBS73388_001503 [Aspergillus brasiliensis]GKZ43093.1 hypothetical protein AbraIFM66951_003458 [Aspergillus brasiliensis]
MPMTWNETTDARLLVGILTTTSVKLDMHALAKFMGPGCTVSAVQHRIQRLKDKVGTVSTTSTPGEMTASPATTSTLTTLTSPGNETPTPATPEKRKRGRPRKNPVAGGGGTTASAAPAAAKKPKAKRAKKATPAATAPAVVVKNEDSGGDGDDDDETLSDPGVPETPSIGGGEEGAEAEAETPAVTTGEEDEA